MKIYVAGEGPDEIGDWAKDPAYLPAAPSGGVIESLLRRVRADGWSIVAGCPWRRIRKFKAGRDLHGLEVRNVLGVIDRATEAGCDCVAFVRDRDGEVEREQAIEAAIDQAGTIGLPARIIGGVAIETTDAWILALLGEPRTEQRRDPKGRLRDEHGVEGGSRKAEIAAGGDFAAAPADAHSLRRWLARAADVLNSGAAAD